MCVKQCHVFLTALQILSPVREIQRVQDQGLHVSLSYCRARLSSSPRWCLGDHSEILWVWRTARSPPATPCSTSVSTLPSAIWTKPSSPSSSSRGKAWYTITACVTSVETCRMACGHVPVCLPPIILAVLPEGTLVQRLIRVHRDSIVMLTTFHA